MLKALTLQPFFNFLSLIKTYSRDAVICLKALAMFTSVC